MPIEDTEQNLELDGDVENLDGDATEGDNPPDDTNEEAAAAEDKRIRDLQSRADKAEARANKAEAALAKSVTRDGNKGESKDPERDALLVELREASLDSVYGEYPELRRYGIDRNLVEGRTRAEMRESATSLVALVKSVATKAKNDALKEAGLSAEPVGGTRQPPKDYASMSDEDFEKELARARSGGASSLF